MPVAVVTGGASGTGRSICQHLARKGHAVVVADIDGDGAAHLAKENAADGGRAVACRADVGSRADVDRAVDLTHSEFGPVGILVTSAGVTNVEPFSKMTLESSNRVIGINLTGTFHCAQAVLPDMVDAG